MRRKEKSVGSRWRGKKKEKRLKTMCSSVICLEIREESLSLRDSDAWDSGGFDLMKRLQEVNDEERI